MSSISGFRGIKNKLKKIKTISKSMEEAKEEFKKEFEKAANELNEIRQVLEDIIDNLKKV